MVTRRILVAVWLALALVGHAGPAHAQTFATPLNNASSTLGADHTAGSGTLVLKAGDGAMFGTPTPTAPIRVTVARKSTLSGGNIVRTTVQTIFLCTGRTGDTLTGCTATENTSDQAFSRADPVAALITQGTIKELQDAITAITAVPPNTTTTYAITNANIVSTFVGTDTVVGGVTARGFYADAEIAFSAKGSSCTLPSVYLTGSNQATVTVDGGTPVALVPTTANTFSAATVFSGLPDTTHNVIVKWIDLQFSYIASANTVSVTGAAPALSLYPGYSQSWNILTDAVFKTHTAALGFATSTVTGYSLLQTAAGGSSGFNFWTDTEIDLPSGSFGTVSAWVGGYGQSMCLRVDGINYPTVTAPNDHHFHWLTLASTPTATAGTHVPSIHVTYAPGPVYVYAVMTTGGAGLTGTAAGTAKPTIAFNGDSITQALTGTGLDSSKGYAHELCRRLNVWCANRAISGSTVYDSGSGAPCHLNSGMFRAADLATIPAIVAGTDTTVVPRTVVNLYGVNDFLGVCAVRTAVQHQADYAAMLASQQAALPAARIIVFGLSDYQGQNLTAFRAAQSAAAAGAGVPYYPLDNTLNVNFALTTFDGLHPSPYGYQAVFVPLMAPLIAAPAPLPQSADAALASGALAWSTNTANTLKVRTPAGTLTGVPGLDTANVFTAAQTIPTIYGSTVAGGNLQLFSTSNATKGKILLGPNSAYDGTNERIGLGTQSPARKFHATGAAGPIVARYEYTGAEGLTATDLAGAEFYTSAGHVGDVFVSGNAYPTTGSLSANGLFLQNVHATGNIGILVRGDDATTSGKFFINTGGYQSANERFTILGTGGSAGFVGLTQPVPVVRLHVGAGTDAPSLGAPSGTLLYMSNPGPTFQDIRDSTNHVSMTMGSNSAGTHVGSRTAHDFALISGATTRLTLTSAGQLTVADGSHIATGTTTGTKIGTATTQKVGFYNATPVVQGVAIPDSNGTQADDTRAVNAVLARMRAMGLIAP
jgi:lysophospholipase L1-like esterase